MATVPENPPQAAEPQEGWWDTHLPLKEAERDLVMRCWESFKNTRRWPAARTLILALGKERFDAAASRWQVATIVDDPNGKVVAPSSDALLHVASVRELLSPVPAVLREACRRFIARPNTVDERATRVLFSEVSHRWSGESQLALALLNDRQYPLSFRNGSDDPWFEPRFEVLRHEHVETLEGAMFEAPRRRPVLEKEITGPHLELLRAIYRRARTHGAWPQSLQLALEERALGYVPELIEDLADFKASSSGNFSIRHSEIELRYPAIPFLEPIVVERLLSAIHALGRAWEEPTYDERSGAKLATIASSLEISLTETAALFLLLAREPWAAPRLSGPLESWSMGATAQLLDFKQAKSWADYLRIAHPEDFRSGEAPPPIFTGPAIDLATGQPWSALDADPLAAFPEPDQDGMREPETGTPSTSEDRLRTLLASRGLTLGEEIGHGGHARVYRATHSDLGFRAVKVFDPHVFNRTGETRYRRARERFRREARNLSRLRSPSIARIIDASLDDEPAFIVTELCEGVDLKRWTRERGLFAPEAALPLLGGLLEALEEVHSAGLVHRDVSAANVICDERQTRLSLIDFGLSGFLEADLEDRLTTTAMGTQGFVAPELLDDPTDVHVQLDVYSAGAVLHWMLTGRVPQQSDDKLIREMRAETGAFVARATARKRSERFSSMSEMRDGLSTLMRALIAREHAVSGDVV